MKSAAASRGEIVDDKSTKMIITKANVDDALAAAQLNLLHHSGVFVCGGPGNFLSRSQDNLHSTTTTSTSNSTAASTTAAATIAAAEKRKKQTAISSTTTGGGNSNSASPASNRRPISSLGLSSKIAASSNNDTSATITTSAKSSPRNAASSQFRKNSLPGNNNNGEMSAAAKRKESTPTLKSSSTSNSAAAANSATDPTTTTKCSSSNNKKSPAAGGACSSQQVADARITKTKLTVTELQKQKQDLEQQVSELVKKAEVKQQELATLKMEIRRLKEERDRELENLQRENKQLRLRLRTLSPDAETAAGVFFANNKNANSTTTTIEDDEEEEENEDEEEEDCGIKIHIDAATSPVPFSTGAAAANRQQRSTRQQQQQIVDQQNAPAAEATDPADTAVPADADSGAGAGAAAASAKAKDWDRQSTSSMSEVSLACLQDRIVQMEENHYSTNEELQATLQELTDLQDIVNDLSKENIQLSEEKGMLLDSLCSQAQKMNNYQLQIENMKHLLLSSTEFRMPSSAARSGFSSRSGGDHRPPHHRESPHDDQQNNRSEDSDQRRTSEREQQLVDLLKNTHEEHEELSSKYEDVRAALRQANEEKLERSELVDILRDRSRSLETQIDTLTSEKKSIEDQLRECKQQSDRDRREIQRLTNACEKERCRIEGLLTTTRKSMDGEEEKSISSSSSSILLEKLRTEKSAAEDRANALEETLNRKSQDYDAVIRERDQLSMDLRLSRSELEQLNESNLEQRLRDADREVENLKKQTVELRATMLELEERCRRYGEDKKEYRSSCITLQKSIDDLEADRSQLQRRLSEERALREQEREEWRQFQSDLQVAVVVANDFKNEAQSDIERLLGENNQLRDRLSALSEEMEKVRISNSTPPDSAPPILCPLSSSSNSTSNSSNIGKSGSGSGNKKQQQKSSPYFPPASNLIEPPTAAATTTTAASSMMKGLSVRALVESLESSGSGHHRSGSAAGVIRDLRSTPPMLRSPGSSSTAATSNHHHHPPARHSSVSGSAGNGGTGNGSAGTGLAIKNGGGGGIGDRESPMIGDHLSKSSGHLAGGNVSSRPISVDSVVEGLLAKQAVTNNNKSEAEVKSSLAITGCGAGGSPLKKKNASPAGTVPDVVINAQEVAAAAAAIIIDAAGNGNGSGDGDGTEKPPTKGILVLNRATAAAASGAGGAVGIGAGAGGGGGGNGRRSGSYLIPDGKDPLSKLMKDAPRGSRRNALLRWCQMKTAGYNGVEITNFSSSWNDGLAFCALLHSLAPNKIPYKTLDPKDKRRNFTISFQTAADLGIPPSLNVDDMLSLERPDWQSVMSYVTAIYKHFEG